MRQNKSADALLDARSQGRKRARKKLEEIGRPFRCECKGCKSPKCGVTLNDTPTCRWKPIPPLGRGNNLDVNHINKNILDDDPVNLEYLCRPCHKAADSVTEKGVSKIEDEMGYGFP